MSRKVKVSAAVYFGNGVPTAATGPKGSLYMRRDGGANTTLYVREAAGAAVVATATLDGVTIANNNTVTIGGQLYTFKTALSTGPTVPNEVLVGASDSDSLDNLIAAINGAAGSGTTYSTGTEANAYVTAAAGAGDTAVVTAKAAGAAGNGVTLAQTLTSGSWSSSATTGGTFDNGTGWVAK
jgi:hypothetical protein